MTGQGFRVAALSCAAVLALAGCGRDAVDAPEPSASPVQPVTPRHRVGPVPSVDTPSLRATVENLEGLSSFVLYQRGAIRHEHYANGATRTRPSNIKSASKSVLGVLTGIALERGHLDSLDTPVADLLPANFGALDDERKRQITVEHLLTMSSGLRSTSFRNYGAWVTSPDWVAFALAQPLEHAPGTRMVYSTGDTHLLAAALTAATGVPLRQFAQQHLFDPLGVRIGGWDRDPQGVYFGGNNMALSPAALVELGALHLNDGRRNGQQLVPPDWIARSWQAHFPGASFNHRRHDYGYLWWRNTLSGHDVWFAWGHGGQHLFIVPSLDAVVVFTANPDRRHPGLNNAIYAAMEQAVIPWLHHTPGVGAPFAADAEPGRTH